MSKLRRSDEADRFGPTMPSLDGIDCDGAYSDDNLRVVLLGVNILRGRGSEADMYRMAQALAAGSAAMNPEREDG
jgi:hypothetical protein